MVAVGGFWVVLLIVAIAGGTIAGSIASKKGHSAGGYFALGFFFPLIGIIVAAVLRPTISATPPPQPPNWYPDPWGHARLRYYDGHQWTYHTDPPHPQQA